MVTGKVINSLFGMRGYGWIFQLLILISFFLVIYWVLKDNKPKESALDIVKKRYAKGEISEKEFLKIKKDLH